MTSAGKRPHQVRPSRSQTGQKMPSGSRMAAIFSAVAGETARFLGAFSSCSRHRRKRCSGEDVVGAVGLVEFAAPLALRQYSLASMMVRMRVVTAGSAGSGEWTRTERSK